MDSISNASEIGLATRKQVMGEAFVAAAQANTTPFTSRFKTTSAAPPGATPGSARGWI